MLILASAASSIAFPRFYLGLFSCRSRVEEDGKIVWIEKGTYWDSGPEGRDRRQAGNNDDGELHDCCLESVVELENGKG